jgi:hypothetical protein
MGLLDRPENYHVSEKTFLFISNFQLGHTESIRNKLYENFKGGNLLFGAQFESG